MSQTVGPHRARLLPGTLILAFVAACSGSSEPSPAVATVQVSPASASPRVGETVQLSATVKDASGNILSGQSVSWSSSAAAVASVSNSGLVTANALGTATITAASGTRSGVATITVAPEPVTSITLNPTNDTLFVRETVTLIPTLRDATNTVVTGRPVSWSSADPTIATVSNTGVVTGADDGTTTITASADGVSATATVRVINPCLTANALPIAVGQTVDAALSTFDCRLTDGTFADGYAIGVSTATDVQIDMTASFDTWLILLEINADTLALSAENDDVGPNDTNSRITFTLQPDVQYFILANSFEANAFGDYRLSVVPASFVAGAAVVRKPGKAPVSTLLKALRPRR
jgi:hypothetical protein